jgi:hypothetical protein
MFPQSYEDSRAEFRQSLAVVQQQWPKASQKSHCINETEDLTIDWIEAGALADKTNLLIFTTGEHGIEGYVGAAMLRLFVQEFLARLNPQTTGLLLVHAISPWGMQHHRRTNAANVDVNRNFTTSFDPSFNPDYSRIESFLNPRRLVRGIWLDSLTFLIGLAKQLASLGQATIQKATLLGQYRFPKGIYYGGDSIQPETQTMMDLYRQHMGNYQHIVHLDMHTGYGPRYQMSLVNSWLEARDSAELSQRFGYPLVVKATPSEFYSIQGDMIDYVYALVEAEFPGRQLYATSFEFGAYGDSLLANLRGLRTMILENRLYWFDPSGSPARERIQHDLQELFAPEEQRWREKAMADARQAFEGILSAEGLLQRTPPGHAE